MAIVVQLHNADLDDLFVSVRDLNLAGQPFIVDGLRLPEDQLFAITVQENASGSSGNILWRVARVSDPDRPAERSVEVEAATTVDLSANFG
jgi:hypothetical protein